VRSGVRLDFLCVPNVDYLVFSRASEEMLLVFTDSNSVNGVFMFIESSY